MLMAVANAGTTLLVCLALVWIARTTIARRGVELPIEPMLVAMVAGAAPIASIATSQTWSVEHDVLLATITVSAWTDLKTGLILNSVLGISGCAILFAAIAHATGGAALVGAVVCAVAPGMLWLATKGRGIGLGDAKLAALLGGALGVAGGMFSLGVAFIAGALYVAGLAASGRLPQSRTIVFGPFLAVGGVAALACSVVGML